MDISQPPVNSSIKVDPSPEGLKLSWSLPTSAGRFFVTAFMLFWLCGWAAGEVMAIKQLLAGNIRLFTIGWLGAWTVGGAIAMLAIWNSLRPMRPETVLLSFDSFTHFPGYAPVVGGGLQNNGKMPSLREWLQKPVSLTLSRQLLASGFTLDRVGERQRLFFDHGANRIEIGKVLNEPEREWLRELLEKWRLS